MEEIKTLIKITDMEHIVLNNIWEKMIDKVFGIENKADYFPKTTWYVNGSKYDNASLEPDTIMCMEQM